MEKFHVHKNNFTARGNLLYCDEKLSLNFSKRNNVEHLQMVQESQRNKKKLKILLPYFCLSIPNPFFSFRE